MDAAKERRMSTTADQIFKAINAQNAAIRELQNRRGVPWLAASLLASIVLNLALVTVVTMLAVSLAGTDTPVAAVAHQAADAVTAPAITPVTQAHESVPEQPIVAPPVVNRGPLQAEPPVVGAMAKIRSGGVQVKYDEIERVTTVKLAGIEIGERLWLSVSGSTLDNSFYGILSDENGATVPIARGFLVVDGVRHDLPSHDSLDRNNSTFDDRFAADEGLVSMRFLDMIADGTPGATLTVRDRIGRDWTATFEEDDQLDIIRVREALRDVGAP